MSQKITLLTITKNSAQLLFDCLNSVSGIVDDIVIIDDDSTDKTLVIAKQFKAEIYHHHEINLGKQKAYGLAKVNSDWVLVLDSDERLSDGLKKEISKIKDQISSPQFKKQNYSGYMIKYQNHLFGRPINYGGENYSMLRLFNKHSVTINSDLVHEQFKLIHGCIGTLDNKILHYSYRSLGQIFTKFTDYARREAQRKYQNGETVSLKKLILYPIHMFYARFIQDHGYKDGLFRLPLDFGFAYMEFMTYIFMIFQRQEKYRDQGNKPSD